MVTPFKHSTLVGCLTTFAASAENVQNISVKSYHLSSHQMTVSNKC